MRGWKGDERNRRGNERDERGENHLRDSEAGCIKGIWGKSEKVGMHKK